MKRVVAGLVIRKNTQGKKEILLMQSNKDFEQYSKYYYPPGGHVEQYEDDYDALRREFREELNVAVEPKKKLVESLNDLGEQTAWWLCEIHGSLQKNEKEVTNVNFFTCDEMKTMNIWPASRKIVDTFLPKL